MKVKPVINLLLGLIAIASTAATVFLISHQIEYFFIFPTLALVSMILLFGLNLPKLSMRQQSQEFERKTKEIQSLPLTKRVFMLGIIASIMLVASVSLIAVSNSIETPVIDKFVLSFVVPWLICQPVYSLFDSIARYPAIIGIIASWCAISLTAFEHFNIAGSTNTYVMLGNIVGFILMLELSRHLTFKLTGYKPLFE